MFSATQVEPPPPGGAGSLIRHSLRCGGDSLTWATRPLQQLAGELGCDVVYEAFSRPGRLL